MLPLQGQRKLHLRNQKLITYRVTVLYARLSHFSHAWLFVILWAVAYRASLSMGFSRQEYWSGLPCPPPGELPDPGIEPMVSPALQADSLPSEPPDKPKEYWSGLPCPPPEDLPNPRIEPKSLASPPLAGWFCMLFLYLGSFNFYSRIWHSELNLTLSLNICAISYFLVL